MVDEVNVLLMFPSRTRDPKKLEHVLRVVESEPLLRPTHANPDERKRTAYDLATAVAAGTKGPWGGLQLWRTKAPKFKGDVSARNQTHNAIALDYAAPFRANDVSELFGAATRLAETLKPDFGFVHMLWESGEDVEQYNYGIRTGIGDVARLGLCNVHARTWFGPGLIQVIGESQLLGLPGAERTAWGGVQLDLAERPWTATFEALHRRQRQVLDALRPLGVLGDYSGAPLEWEPAPKWRELTWATPIEGK